MNGFDKIDDGTPSGADTGSPMESNISKVEVGIQQPPPSNGMIRATGIGFPPPHIAESGRRRALAKRAAELDAMRRLAEQIKGAVVQSESSADMSRLSKDEVQVHVNALLSLAIVVSETTNPDGSVEVVMEAPEKQRH